MILFLCNTVLSLIVSEKSDINKAIGKNLETPVLYITQAIGLAVGLSPKELGLQRHFVPVKLPVKNVQNNKEGIING